MLLITAGTMIVYSVFDYLFTYAILDYSNSWMIIRDKMIPISAYTIITAFPMYIYVRKIHEKFVE